MVLPLYPTLTIGFVTFVVWYTITRGQQRKRYPPGPYPIPLIGNLRNLIGSKCWSYLNKLQKEHGDVFTVFMGTKPAIVLCSLDAVREAYISKQNDFAGRPKTYSFDVIVKGSDIVGGQFGPIWNQQRKIAHSAIRTFASGAFLPHVIQHSLEMESVELDKVARTGRKFKLKHHIDMITYNIIASIAFGKTFEPDDGTLKDFISMQDEFNEVVGNVVPADLIPVLKYFPIYSNRVLHKVAETLRRTAEEIYKEHEQNFDENNPRDIMDHFLKSVKDIERHEGKRATTGLTVLHLEMMILDVFMAGTETTKSALMWCILHMAAFPKCQKKLQEDVDRVLGPHTSVLSEHRPELPYTDAFLHEVLRMKPNGPIGLPRETTCDTSVGGYPIPAGTLVIPYILALHMNKDVWGDPEVFRPKRFLDNDGKMGPHISSWMPFSTGRRVCIGEALAKAGLHLALAAFVQRYEVSAPPGVQIDLSPKDVCQIMMPNEDNELTIKRRW